MPFSQGQLTCCQQLALLQLLWPHTVSIQEVIYQHVIAACLHIFLLAPPACSAWEILGDVSGEMMSVDCVWDLLVPAEALSEPSAARLHPLLRSIALCQRCKRTLTGLLRCSMSAAQRWHGGNTRGDMLVLWAILANHLSKYNLTIQLCCMDDWVQRLLGQQKL